MLNTLDDALYNLELSSLRVYDEHIILRIVDLTNRGAETKVERVGDGDAGKERVDEREKGARVDNSTSKVSVWVRTLITRPVAVPCQRHHTHKTRSRRSAWEHRVGLPQSGYTRRIRTNFNWLRVPRYSRTTVRI